MSDDSLPEDPGGSDTRPDLPDAIPVHLVETDGLDAALASLDPVAADWARSTGFTGKLGQVAMLERQGHIDLGIFVQGPHRAVSRHRRAGGVDRRIKGKAA